MTSVVFFGSNQYSVQILKKILTISDLRLLAVVTKPDAPVGRVQQITKNPVAAYVETLHATSLHPTLLQPLEFDQNFTNQLKELKADLAICVAYGPPFFTTEIINLYKYKIINLHPSPLPRYRGAAPGPWQIANGEASSAMSYFVIDELPDHGPVIDQISFPILPTDTSADFYNRAFQVGAANLDVVLSKYLSNPSNTTAQDHSQKTYFPKMNKDIARIDWNKPPEYIEAFIRAMLPWPIAWTEVVSLDGQKKRAQILSSHLQNGKLVLDQVKIEGKNTQNWKDVSRLFSVIKTKS